tara:strand:+ start:91 stop:495 length:405 start_codon:yes stop_codon:yes gene_type:complete
MERILEIKEIEDDTISGFVITTNTQDINGFVITTDTQDIKLYIDNDQQCCENWGYLMSQDDFKEFIGAEVLDIKVVNTALSTVEVPEMYEGDMMFINIETSEGTLQFTAYNEHNGYYSHSAGVISKQLTVREYL